MLRSVASACSIALLAAAGLVLCGLAKPAMAEVRTTVQSKTFSVAGTTAASLVSNMMRNPYDGDHGGAYANIRPNYSLSIKSKQSGKLCRASVDVDIRFVITLPRAQSPSAMSARTRSAWNSFVAFATSHEEHHRQSYTACARSFVNAAERLSAANCVTLNKQIRQLFTSEKRACEVKQQPYDRQQTRAVYSLSLFTMAKSRQ